MQPCIEHSATNILYVEDNEGDFFLVNEALKETGKPFNLSHSLSIEEIANVANDVAFDVVLLDMNLPGITGLDALKYIRNDYPKTPIITLTGVDDQQRALDFIQHGAQDYLVKGQHDAELLERAIRYAIERKHFENELFKLTYSDQLTGLINYDMLLEILPKSIAFAEQNETPLAIISLNLSDYKSMNDRIGHEEANELLAACAERLKTCVEEEDSIARIRGDHFIILLQGDHAAPDHLPNRFRRIIDTLGRDLEVAGRALQPGCFIGVASHPSCGDDAKSLIQNATTAMQQAREHSKNTIRNFDSSFNDEIENQLYLQRELENAIAEQSLEPYYQPIYDIQNNKLAGAEALLRWILPEKGFIPPDIFIPIAEHCELMQDVSTLVINKVCEHYKTIQSKVKQPFYISVNLSTQELDQSLPQRIEDIFQRTNTSPKHIALEVTESLLMDDPKESRITLAYCKRMGNVILIDDFGTGYSSLSHLSKLPLDRLKIDRGFVMDMETNEQNMVIVKSTIQLAHGLGLKVVAEGVETQEQLDLLRELGCDCIQGYFFAKPMPASDFVTWLDEGHSL